MDNLRLINLGKAPNLIDKAAAWFHEKWDVPTQAYRESMEQSANNSASVPCWYVVLSCEGRIVAGAGIIENDFHERKDLSPNICALYVDPECRGNGVARRLLGVLRSHAGHLGFPELYLVTDHTEFYEKCGWEFLTVVSGDDGEQERMYVADTLTADTSWCGVEH